MNEIVLNSDCQDARFYAAADVRRSCIVEKLQENFIGEALQFARNAKMTLNAIHLPPKYACRQSPFPARRR
jgi:hypothetical protein